MRNRGPLVIVAVLASTLAGLALGGVASGCREGSRRDMVTTRSSTSASSASTSTTAASAASASADASSVIVDVEDGGAGASGAGAIDSALPPGAIAYGPATLSGKLVEETFYGPPGYGSDPARDKKEPALVLQLAQTIDVLRPPDGGVDTDVDRLGVAKISLTDPKDAGLDLQKLVGQRIVVKGTLFGAHTAHHHTDVLMSGVEVVPQ